MKVVYDPDKDILQISLCDRLVEETTQISPGLILDYDGDGVVIGIEVRKASQRTDNPDKVDYSVGAADENKPKPKVEE